MVDSKPLMAFYGATGASTIPSLVPALKAGYDRTARKARSPLATPSADSPPVVRTLSKLTALLLEKGVPQSAIYAHLTISKGDVFNADD